MNYKYRPIEHAATGTNSKDKSTSSSLKQVNLKIPVQEFKEK